MQSKYLVFEGTDGTGKSSMCQKALNYLNVKLGENSTILTAHPGATKLGQKLRHLIKHDTEVSIDPMTERILFAADNNAFVKTLLRPTLEKNINVLSDRCNFISDIPYGIACNADINRIKTLHSIINTPPIDLLLIFYCPWEIAKSRMCARSADLACKIESRGDQYFQKVNEIYDNIITTDSAENLYIRKYVDNKDIKIINASVSVEAVWAQVKSYLDEFFAVPVV